MKGLYAVIERFTCLLACCSDFEATSPYMASERHNGRTGKAAGRANFRRTLEDDAVWISNESRSPLHMARSFQPRTLSMSPLTCNLKWILILNSSSQIFGCRIVHKHVFIGEPRRPHRHD